MIEQTQLIEANVSSFTFDKSGNWCYISFYPCSGDSFSYFTIIPKSQIHSLGAIPSVCQLLLSKQIPKEIELFVLKPDSIFAEFAGVPYYGRFSNKTPFWYFNPPSNKVLGNK